MLIADSTCVAEVLGSPNHDERSGDAVDILVLHYTGMESAAAAVERLCDPEAKVSSHYVIHEDGAVVQLVSEARRARHAGVSSWRGWTDINSRSIGIEIVNGGHDFGCPEFPPEQIEAVIRLCIDIRSRWPIPQRHVLGHSDVAPSRKRDPGEKFPWQRLNACGVGVWVEPSPIAAGESKRAGDLGEGVTRLKAALRSFGYGVATNADFDDEMVDVVTAFQRHFRPARVDGVADGSTEATLHRLLSAIGNSGVS